MKAHIRTMLFSAGVVLLLPGAQAQTCNPTLATLTQGGDSLPTPPALAAGSKMCDPKFQSEILRVTDQNTLGGNGTPLTIWKPAYSTVSALSKDSTWIAMSIQGGGGVIMAFDKDNMRMRTAAETPANWVRSDTGTSKVDKIGIADYGAWSHAGKFTRTEPQCGQYSPSPSIMWSPVNDNIFYSVHPNCAKLYEFNMATLTYRSIADFSTILNFSPPNGLVQGDTQLQMIGISADGTKIGLSNQIPSLGHSYNRFIVYNLVNGATQYGRGRQLSLVNHSGNPSVSLQGYYLSGGAFNTDGRFLRASLTNYVDETGIPVPAGQASTFQYTIDLQTATTSCSGPTAPEPCGIMASPAYSITPVTSTWVAGHVTDTGGFIVGHLEAQWQQGGQTYNEGYVRVNPTSTYPVLTQLMEAHVPSGLHMSMNNLTGPWVYGSAYNATPTDLGPFRQEIFALSTTPPNAYRRIAHHWSNAVTYDLQPHAAQSLDGKFVVFGSSWGRTDRVDTFIVKVPPVMLGPSTPTFTVSPTPASAPVNTEQNFTFSFTDPSGAANMHVMSFLIQDASLSAPALTNACYGQQVNGGGMVFANDAGVLNTGQPMWLGTQSANQENSQCRLIPSASVNVTTSGNTRQFTLRMLFKSAWANKNLKVFAKSANPSYQETAPWTEIGTINVPAQSVTPASGVVAVNTNRDLTFSFADLATFPTDRMLFLIQDSAVANPTITSACHAYQESSGGMVFANDAGVFNYGQPLWLGSSWAVPQENTQCKIIPAQSVFVTSSGGSKQFTVRMQFKSAWAGKTLKIFAKRAKYSPLYSEENWTQVGTVTVQ